MLAIILSLFVFGPFTEAASKLDETAARVALTEIFRRRIITNEREWMTFHYENKEMGDHFEPRTAVEATDRIFNHALRFYTPSELSRHLAGPGIYVASESASSRGYGGDKPQLYVIPIRPGARLINAEMALTDEDEKIALSAGQTFNCEPEDLSSASNLILMLRGSKNERCRSIAIRIFSELRVQGVTFGYGEPMTPAGCRPRLALALNIIDPSIIDFSSFAFVSDEHVFGAARTLGFTRALYADTDDPVAKRYELPKLLLSLAVDDAGYVPWRTSRILGCGEPRAAEANPQDLPIDVWKDAVKKSFRDPNIAALEERTFQAFGVKFFSLRTKAGDSVNFHSFKLRVIQRLIHQVVTRGDREVPFASFARAWALVDEGALNNADSQKQIASLLHDVDRANPDDQTSRLAFASHPPPPTGLPDLRVPYRATGVSPRLATLLFEVELTSDFRVPLLVRPRGRNGLTRAFDASRRKLTEVLHDCLSVYEDPRATPRDIQNGRCAVDVDVNWVAPKS